MTRNRANSVALTKKWKREHPERVAAYASKYHSRLRNQCLDLLGRKCACCGEDEHAFLCIDHIGGGGNEHRRQLGYKKGTGGTKFFNWLLKEAVRVGIDAVKEKFRTLCWNCNSAVHFYGECPHARLALELPEETVRSTVGGSQKVEKSQQIWVFSRTGTG